MQASSVYKTRERTLLERSHFRGVAMVQSRRHRMREMTRWEEGEVSLLPHSADRTTIMSVH